MFIPYHQLIGAESEPAAWMLCLHGVYGSGANWRTFANRLVALRPDWGVALVDLRIHGRSRAAPPPHTMATAAADLIRLTAQLAADDKPVRAVCGHSLGGKVALRYRLDAGDAPAQTWVIDSSPSRQPGAFDQPDNTVVAVLRMLEHLPRVYESRKHFIDRVIEYGFPAALAQWLAMNLDHGAGRYHLGLALEAVRDLLADYYDCDVWAAVESPGDVRVVIAGASTAVGAGDRERFMASGATTYTFAESGHWVHIEALGRLVEVVSAALPDDMPEFR